MCSTPINLVAFYYLTCLRHRDLINPMVLCSQQHSQPDLVAVLGGADRKSWHSAVAEGRVDVLVGDV